MKKQLLFVCLGNICRSPSGEAVFRKLVEEAALDHKIGIDSAGISGFHEGEPADSRMKQHAIKRNYHLTSLSRPVHGSSDGKRFDYIIAMDEANKADLQEIIAPEHHHKIYMMNDFSMNFKGQPVPDPYYGGDAGFEMVLDMLEESCNGLLEQVKRDL